MPEETHEDEIRDRTCCSVCSFILCRRRGCVADTTKSSARRDARAENNQGGAVFARRQRWQGNRGRARIGGRRTDALSLLEELAGREPCVAHVDKAGIGRRRRPGGSGPSLRAPEKQLPARVLQQRQGRLGPTLSSTTVCNGADSK